MQDNIGIDKHFTGKFYIADEEIAGELIYNKKNGIILLNLIKTLVDPMVFGKSYKDVDIITGTLNSGAVVTLFKNKCVKNHTQAFQSQQINYVSKYLIWSKDIVAKRKFHKMRCIVENGLTWSELSRIDSSDFNCIKIKDKFDKKTFDFFGAKISFFTSLNCELFSYPIKEESKVYERLMIEIEPKNEQDPSCFISLRDKILSFISFAIRDNINVIEQYLYDYNDSYLIGGEITEYYKHTLITSERNLSIQNTTVHEYNFLLSEIATENINEELTKLEPIFNLYLSLFKYMDMPIEMIFLNIVQALETFHSRFFYEDKKEKYIKSVMERFGESKNFKYIEPLLLSDTQKDPNCSYIILLSRLNDLFIGKNDGLFSDYYVKNPQYAQIVADTRHYYTHYGKSKENKALKGDELLKAIYVLTSLLEYHICLILGIDIRQKIVQRLNTVKI